MLKHKFLFFIFALTLIFTFLPQSYIFAQEGEIVTAEVVVDTLNVRVAPSGWRRSTKIGTLQRGAVVIVHAHETADGNYHWINVTHPESGLTGWVVSKYVLFNRADWQDYLPVYQSLHELSQLDGETRQPYSAVIAGNGGGIHVWAEPYRETLIGTFPNRTPITVTGRAVVNGQTSTMIYVEQEDGDLKGWVSIYYVGTPYGGYRDWLNSVPVTYERDFREEYSDLPQAHIVVYGLNLRREPSLSGTIINYHVQGTVVVHGRTNHETEGWVYVTFIDSSSYWYCMAELSGWIFDPNWDTPYLHYENGLTRDSLPIIAP